MEGGKLWYCPNVEDSENIVEAKVHGYNGHPHGISIGPMQPVLISPTNCAICGQEVNASNTCLTVSEAIEKEYFSYSIIKHYHSPRCFEDLYHCANEVDKAIDMSPYPDSVKEWMRRSIFCISL